MFELELKLGNAAMCTGADIADALRRAADWIEDYEPGEMEDGRAVSLFDQNGNRVGEWRVSL